MENKTRSVLAAFVLLTRVHAYRYTFIRNRSACRASISQLLNVYAFC